MLVEILTRALGIASIIGCSLLIVKTLKIFVFKDTFTENGAGSAHRFYAHLLFGMIYFFAAVLCVYIIPPLKHLSVSLFAGSGVLAIVIGFAAQHSLANIISGSFIAIFKPFRVGDKVKFIGKDVVGTVEDITLRHTMIRTFENKRVMIPNSVVSVDIIENAHIVEEKVCRFLEIGISYDSDHDKAMRIMKEEVINHSDYFDNRSSEEKEKGVEAVKVRILGFSDSSVKLRAWVWAKDNPTGFEMLCDLNKSIKERFDKEGIEIPYPYRTIVHKN